jgi:hypothetical protein
MPFFAAYCLAGDGFVEVFVDPDAHEWRELEAAVDPVDGVRAFVIGGRLYAWTPPLLHEEVEPLLRETLGAGAAGAEWVPACIVPALHLVTVTTTFEPARADGEGLRRRLEDAVRGCVALQRRFRGDFTIRHAWRLREAA